MEVLHRVVAQAAALSAAGERPRAAALLARIQALVPDHVETLHLLGIWAIEADETGRAAVLLGRALLLRPDDPFLRANLTTAFGRLGAARHTAGDADGAAAAFRRALSLRPDDAQTWCNLATVRTSAAAASLRRALALHPGLATAHTLLAATLNEAGQPKAAAAAARRALRLDPMRTGAWTGFAAACLKGAGSTVAAAAAGRNALATEPAGVEGWADLGLALFRQGRIADAVALWRRALAIDPDHPPCRWHNAYTLLLHGRLEEGWREYEWRWRAFSGKERVLPGRPWNGEDARGLTILLHHEQGLGDSIQFIRFAAPLRAQGARVLAECPTSLRRLLDSAPGVDGWIAAGEPAPPCDRHVSLMSLPGLLGVTRPDRIPAPVPYLRAEPARVAAWRQRLDPGPDGRPGLRVGLVWRGSNADLRSLPLAALEPLGRLPGLRLIGLQKAAEPPHPFDRVPPGLAVEQPGPGFDAGPDGFLDTAAVMMSLDLVLTIDTAAAHLAGALGVPAWVMLPFVPDWRWLLEREDTPWYPTLRLFRQPAPGDWASVVARVADALEALAARRQAARSSSDAVAAGVGAGAA